MIEAYKWGQKVLELVAVLRDFLLYQPFKSAVEANAVGRLIFFNYKNPLFPDDWFWQNAFPHEWIEVIENLSIGEILFSSAVIGILLFKVAKFFIGIITGS